MIGHVDDQGHLIAMVPDSIAPGEVEIVVIARGTGEDDAGDHWMAGIAREWHDDLNDPRQDIYSLDSRRTAKGVRLKPDP